LMMLATRDPSGLALNHCPTPEIVHHWAQLANSCVQVMLAITLSSLASTIALAVEDWEHDWTVVTMARNGSWGVSTDASLSLAIAAAIRDCKTMSVEASDCGSQQATVRNRWTIAWLCGEHKILASESRREDAEASALFQLELRRAYATDIPPCRTILTVNPRGEVTIGETGATD
jgi:hypothetical protein